MGGPDDGALLRRLGASDDALARLDVAPYGLFPDGRARRGDAVSLSRVALPLPEAIAGARAQVTADDPNLAYIASGRAWAAGGRSDAERAAAFLSDAGEAFRFGWGG